MSRLPTDVVVLDPHRKRLRFVWTLDQLGAGLHRHRILADADAARIAPGFAGADVELPAVPGTLHHLALARIVVTAGLRGLYQPGLDAVGQAAASVRTTVVQGKELAGEIKHHDGAAVHLDQLALAGRNLIDGGDDVARHGTYRTPSSPSCPRLSRASTSS